MEDKVVSQREKIEKYILGMLMYEHPEYADRLIIDDFKDESAKFAFGKIAELRTANLPVNPQSVYNCDGMNAHLEYISDCSTVFHVGVDDEETMLSSLDTLIRMSDVRFIYKNIKELTAKIEKGIISKPDLIVDDLQLIQDRAVSRHINSVDMLVGDSIMEGFRQIAENQKTGRIQMGLPRLDAFMGGGIARGEYVIIAARTNVGKSILSILPALEASRRGHWVMLCSNEMTRAQMGLRMLANRSKVEMPIIEQTRIGTQEEYARMSQAAQELRKEKIRMVPDCYRVSQIRERLEKYRREGIPISLVVLDHIQRIKSDNKAVSKEYDTITEASRSIQELAKKYNCVIIAMAQIGRSGAVAEKISLHDLKGSGSLEEDPDKVFIMYGDKTDKEIRLIELAKNRTGRVGEEPFRLRLDGARMNFTEI